MSARRLASLGLALLILAWAGSAGIAYGVVELTGGGPPGEQGLRGPQGLRGLQGRPGASAFDIISGNPLVEEGFVHPQFALGQLVRFWATEQLSELLGENVTTTHPQVDACVNYIMKLEGSASECGFFGVED